ncbi:MAG TPA: hypothetical protein VF603_13455 [Allosphingosinicella sp.]|jgi:hypothetical protein
MNKVRYSRARLIGMAALMLLATIAFICLFANADAVAGSRRGRFFATAIGHGVVLPLLIALTGFVGCRAAAMAMGTLEAIEFQGSALFVTGIWGRKRIAWSNLDALVLENAGGQQQLAFRTRSGGLFGRTAARVPLGLTEIHSSRVEELMDVISRQRDLACAGHREDVEAPAATESFDADAAMARYLARKAAGEASEPPRAQAAPAAPQLPPRPSFGRKGL